MRRGSAGIPLLAIGVLAAATTARAQVNFGITPLRVEHAIAPGRSLTDAFYLRNSGSAPIRIRVSVENWTFDGADRPDFVKARPVPFGCREWLKVNPQDFRIGPGEIKTVRYTVAVPEGTPAGGYHAAVCFENVPSEDVPSGRSGMTITGRIAGVIYVKSGTARADGEIVDLAPSGDPARPGFVLTMKNAGVTHFRTSGRVELTGEDGTTTAVDVPDEVVLPESERRVRCDLKSRLAPGRYKAFARVDIGGQDLLGFRTEIVIQP